LEKIQTVKKIRAPIYVNYADHMDPIFQNAIAQLKCSDDHNHETNKPKYNFYNEDENDNNDNSSLIGNMTFAEYRNYLFQD